MIHGTCYISMSWSPYCILAAYCSCIIISALYAILIILNLEHIGHCIHLTNQVLISYIALLMITNTCLVHEEHLLGEGRFEFVEFSWSCFFLSGETPLFLSAYFGRAEAARYLLAHGADPKLGGNTGSPLHAAAVKGLSLFPSPTST
jgi:hypothetical protein